MRFIPPTLLVAQVVYTAFQPSLTISHSIILFSLAGLFAWNQWLLSRSTPNLNDEISKLRNELNQQMGQQKESASAKFAILEGELQKISLSVVRSSSSPSKPQPERKNYIF